MAKLCDVKYALDKTITKEDDDKHIFVIVIASQWKFYTCYSV